MGELRSKLEDRSKAVEVLSQQIEDQRDENKTLKRRHAANIKVGRSASSLYSSKQKRQSF